MRERKKNWRSGGIFFFVKNRNNNYFSPFSEKKERGTLFFFSNPFLPRGFFFPFSGTILNDKKVVPKGDRGPKGNT